VEEQNTTGKRSLWTWKAGCQYSRIKSVTEFWRTLSRNYWIYDSHSGPGC